MSNDLLTNLETAHTEARKCWCLAISFRQNKTIVGENAFIEVDDWSETLKNTRKESLEAIDPVNNYLHKIARPDGGLVRCLGRTAKCYHGICLELIQHLRTVLKARKNPFDLDEMRELSALIDDEYDRAINNLPDPPSDARHSFDFRSVKWFGTSYAFTKNQALCIKVLWESWENETLELDGLTVIAQAKAAGNRLIDVFRGNPALGKMIIQGSTKGTYRLNPLSKK